MLNYNEILDSVFTLVRELGHTMHNWYSDDIHPFVAIFVVEVAYTFNEKLLLDYMMTNTKYSKERITLLIQAINNISDAFFRQTRFADYKYQVYPLAEQGKPINAKTLAAIWKKLDKAYFGDVLKEHENHNYVWGRTPHFYEIPYYY